jgi:hypothetical protein
MTLMKEKANKNKTSVVLALFAMIVIVFFAPKVFDFSQSHLAMEDSVMVQRGLMSQGILAISDIFTRDLDRGDKGTDVAHVQAMLIEKEYMPGPIDGFFGYRTEKAVTDFQEDNEIETTGIVDDLTAKKLFGDIIQTQVVEEVADKIDSSGFPELQKSFIDRYNESSGNTLLVDDSVRVCGLHIFTPELSTEIALPFEVQGYLYNNNPNMSESCSWGYDTFSGNAGEVEIWSDSFELIGEGFLKVNFASKNTEEGVFAQVSGLIELVDQYKNIANINSVVMLIRETNAEVETYVDAETGETFFVPQDFYVDVLDFNSTKQEAILHPACELVEVNGEEKIECDFIYEESECLTAFYEEKEDSPSTTHQELLLENPNLLLTEVSLSNPNPYYKPCDKNITDINILIKGFEGAEVVNPYILYQDLTYTGEVIYEGENNLNIYSFGFSGIENIDTEELGIGLHQTSNKTFGLYLESLNVNEGVDGDMEIVIAPTQYYFNDLEGEQVNEGLMDLIVKYGFSVISSIDLEEDFIVEYENSEETIDEEVSI